MERESGLSLFNRIFFAEKEGKILVCKYAIATPEAALYVLRSVVKDRKLKETGVVQQWTEGGYFVVGVGIEPQTATAGAF